MAKTSKRSKQAAREITDKFDVGKGAIRLMILGRLRKGEACGYQIAKGLREEDENFDVKYGVLYPLLERMEDNGLIKGHWEHGRGQDGLHVYRITSAGQKQFAKSQATWARLMKQVRSIIGAKA